MSVFRIIIDDRVEDEGEECFVCHADGLDNSLRGNFEFTCSDGFRIKSVTSPEMGERTLYIQGARDYDDRSIRINVLIMPIMKVRIEEAGGVVINNTGDQDIFTEEIDHECADVLCRQFVAFIFEEDAFKIEEALSKALPGARVTWEVK